MMLNSRDTLLPNGLRVVSATMPQAHSVSVGFWIGVGGRCEPKAWTGISHFIEHLVFKGTRTRSARDISEAIEGRGGDINAFTQEENTCYYARLPSNALGIGVDVLADMIRNPRFAAADVKKERDVVVEEIMMYRDQPQHYVEEMLTEQLWSGHALGRPLTGTVESLRRIGRREVCCYADRMYRPGNIVAAFAGDVRHDECVRQVRRLFPGGVSGDGRRSFAGAGRHVPQQRFTVKGKDIEQAHVAIGFRLFGRCDPRRYALKLLSVALGENMSSRLFQAVREEHGLAYAIQSGVHLFADTGAFVISAGLDRGKIEKAMALIAREVRRVAASGVPAGELDRARDYAIGQLRIGLEGSTNQMTWIGEHFITYGRLIRPEQAIAALEAVTPADVRDLAGKFLSPQRLSVAIIMPDVTDRASSRIQTIMQRV